MGFLVHHCKSFITQMRCFYIDAKLIAIHIGTFTGSRVNIFKSNKV